MSTDITPAERMDAIHARYHAKNVELAEATDAMLATLPPGSLTPAGARDLVTDERRPSDRYVA